MNYLHKSTLLFLTISSCYMHTMERLSVNFMDPKQILRDKFEQKRHLIVLRFFNDINEQYTQLIPELTNASKKNDHNKILTIQQQINKLRTNARQALTSSTLKNHFDPFQKSSDQLKLLIPAFVSDGYIDFEYFNHLTN